MLGSVFYQHPGDSHGVQPALHVLTKIHVLNTFTQLERIQKCLRNWAENRGTRPFVLNPRSHKYSDFIRKTNLMWRRKNKKQAAAAAAAAPAAAPAPAPAAAAPAPAAKEGGDMFS